MRQADNRSSFTCSNLVVYDLALDTFQFAHLSVRECLEKQPEYAPAATNALAAEACLLNVLSAAERGATRRFLTNVLGNLLNSVSLSQLIPYSTVYWAS